MDSTNSIYHSSVRDIKPGTSLPVKGITMVLMTHREADVIHNSFS